MVIENYSQKEPLKWLSIDESLKNIKLFFRLLGLTLNVESTGTKLKENVRFLINMVWMNVALLACFYYFYYGLVEGTELTEMTNVAPGAILSVIGDFKAIYTYLYKDKIKALVDNLRALENNIDIAKLKEVEVRKIKMDVTFLNRVIKILNICNILMLIVFNLSPLVLIVVRYFRTKQLQLRLPFLNFLPFDPFNLMYWPLLYFHQFWSVTIVLLQMCTADFLFYTCCTHIQIQFKLLQCRLEDCVVQSETEDVTVEMRMNFVRVIKWHQDLISNANMLEVITSKATLSNFVMSSVVICLSGFNVTTSNDLVEIMTFLTFLFMALLQIFFLCLFGDMLMKSSSEVSDAVYNCKWYLSDVSTSKNVLLIQTRAQTSCKVTAAGFADVNLRAYMRILSTSWSYFALLNTMYSSDR